MCTYICAYIIPIYNRFISSVENRAYVSVRVTLHVWCVYACVCACTVHTSLLVLLDLCLPLLRFSSIHISPVPLACSCARAIFSYFC